MLTYVDSMHGREYTFTQSTFVSLVPCHGNLYRLKAYPELIVADVNSEWALSSTMLLANTKSHAMIFPNGKLSQKTFSAQEVKECFGFDPLKTKASNFFQHKMAQNSVSSSTATLQIELGYLNASEPKQQRAAEAVSSSLANPLAGIDEDDFKDATYKDNEICANNPRTAFGNRI